MKWSLHLQGESGFDYVLKRRIYLFFTNCVNFCGLRVTLPYFHLLIGDK